MIVITSTAFFISRDHQVEIPQFCEEEEILNKKRSKKIQKKYDERKKNAKISSLLEEQFQQGKLLGKMTSAFEGGGISRYGVLSGV